MPKFNKLAATATLLAAPLLASTVLASGASAAPGSTGARYQVTTYTITQHFNVHRDATTLVFTATNNPCDGSAPGAFTGTGSGTVGYTGYATSITGTAGAATVAYNYVFTTLPADHDPRVVVGQYHVNLPSVPVTDGTFSGTVSDTLNSTQPVTGTITSQTSTYANHGDYVSSNGGTESAAQSCIGQLIK